MPEIREIRKGSEINRHNQITILENKIKQLEKRVKELEA